MRLNEMLDNQPVRLKVGDGNATDLVVPIIGGKYIRIVGMDKYDILRSGGPIAVANDEKAYSAPQGFTDVIDPAIADKQSPTLDVSTPRGRTHFYQSFLEGWGEHRLEDTMSWKIRTEDVGTVPKSELAKYKPGGSKQMTPEFYAQEWEGDFLGYEGLVFPEFIGRAWPAGHLMPWSQFQGLKKGSFIYGSLDWGFSDETVLLWWAKTPQNQVIVFDELCVKNRTPAQVVALARSKAPLPGIVYADPACWQSHDGTRTVGDQFLQAGLRVVRADHRFQPSIEHIRTMMTIIRQDVQPQFMIVEGSAPKLVENMSLLEDNDLQPGGGGFKNHADCHAADSARYGAMTVYAGARAPQAEKKPTYGPLYRPRNDEDGVRYHPVSGRPLDC